MAGQRWHGGGATARDNHFLGALETHLCSDTDREFLSPLNRIHKRKFPNTSAIMGGWGHERHSLSSSSTHHYLFAANTHKENGSWGGLHSLANGLLSLQTRKFILPASKDFVTLFSPTKGKSNQMKTRLPDTFARTNESEAPPPTPSKAESWSPGRSLPPLEKGACKERKGKKAAAGRHGEVLTTGVLGAAVCLFKVVLCFVFHSSAESTFYRVGE